MTSLKCVVEGCNLEYDVICSFSFYNVNTSSDSDNKRQQWIEGAMQEEKECLWRHVSLQLCGYHFELDSQGLWIDSPMLPELLTLQENEEPKAIPTEEDKEWGGVASDGLNPDSNLDNPRNTGFQGLFAQFATRRPTRPLEPLPKRKSRKVRPEQVAEIVRKDHSYCVEATEQQPADISRLNVRQLVDTLGYLSLKSLQRKQLWVVKVETDKSEASITQSEQVITKMTNPKQVIEIVPQTSSASETAAGGASETGDPQVMMMDDTPIDNFIYEIAEETEIAMEEVKEIPAEAPKQWTVNILPDEAKPKYAYIKHTSTGKKKRHFTTDTTELTLQGDFENYYILPDVDPASGVEITTSSLESDGYIVEEYQNYVLQPHATPKRKPRETDPTKKRKKKVTPMREVKEIQIKGELGEDWVIQNAVVYDQDQDQDQDEYDDKKSRVRRKNKKYLGYDFVT